MTRPGAHLIWRFCHVAPAAGLRRTSSSALRDLRLSDVHSPASPALPVRASGNSATTSRADEDEDEHSQTGGTELVLYTLEREWGLKLTAPVVI